MEMSTCKICVESIESHSIDDLFKCGKSALKGKKWDVAEALFDEALKREPENPRAFFGKLMAECECRDENELANHPSHIYNNDSYKKAYQFADDDFKRELDGYNNQVSYNVACQMYASHDIPSIKNALDTFAGLSNYKDSGDMAEKCKEKIYGYAVEHMENAKTEKDFLTAKSEFEIVRGYADADARAAECASKSDDSTSKNVIYQEAMKLGRSDSMIDLKNAIKKMEEIIDYHDAKEKLEIFKNRYQKLTDQTKEDQRQAEIERENKLRKMQEEDEKKAKSARTMKFVIYGILALVIIAALIVVSVMTPDSGASNEAVLLGNADLTDLITGWA